MSKWKNDNMQTKGKRQTNKHEPRDEEGSKDWGWGGG